ncbi:MULTISPECIES: manganese catalase family protein [Anaerotruncus]|jgi:Mn-containing catalase|uniref:manganese catalase family protein n=1 Tax=Anaerotruncus TaxID=244127 RepID=UPI000E537DED|nr:MULTISPECIES: manganese catalase family protein [Anaerotruncus]RGX56167.1 manganese catalase family protein [Anaerotruncus sp. AF02-27]
MYKHEKQLFHPVRVEKANPQYAALLQEQLGGANGELKSAMQYMSQSFRIKDPAIKDLFMDIAAEELSHMEMVGTTINMLNGHDVEAAGVPAGEVETHVLLGLNPGLINASGYSWTADYVTVTGDLCADLLSNIASEQRAKVVYEYLYRQINDKLVRETIDFLLNREEAHNALFREAFNKVQDTGSNRDFGVTEDSRLYFNLSSPSPANHFGDTKAAPPSFNNPSQRPS